MKNNTTSKKKKTAKKVAVTVFSCSMALSNINFVPLMAQTNGVQYTQKANDVYTDFANLSAAANAFTKNGSGNYTIKNTGGNNHVLSDLKAKAFVYETKFKIDSGDRGSLIFGATNNVFTNIGSFFGLELSAKDGNIFVKMFQDNGPGGELLKSTEVLHGVDTKKEISVKLSVDYNKNVELMIDGNVAKIEVDERFKDVYDGGYLGFLTWNSQVTFSDLNVTKINDDYPKLTGLEVSGDGAILTPGFEDEKTSYDLFVPRSVSDIKVKASSDPANTLSMFVTDSKGNVIIEEKPLTSGVNSDGLKLPSGTSIIQIKSTYKDVVITTRIKVNKMYSANELSTEANRPQFHFSPETNFMNDPNGLVYDPSNQTWHMFFQKQPGVGWVNNQAWGHAQSKDLVSWEELPVAMNIDDLGYIFSGSAVVDENNTSGFFTNNKAGESKLVAIFTHHGHGTQVQSIAYSKDHGLTWTKFDGNPVIANPNGSLYSTEFRDPKVFRYDNKWYMVVAGGRGRMFASEDLKTWKHVEDFFFADGRELHSECPDLFPLAVDKDGKEKWVYSGGGEFYVIGRFEKNKDGYYRFVAETNEISAPNGRTNMYATQSYYNDPTGQNRKMLVSWLQDYSAPNSLPDKLWNGIQSLPLVAGIKTVNNREIVTHYPADEIKQLRGSVLYETKNKTVKTGDKNLLKGVTGQIYDIEAEFTLGTATEFGFNLRTGDGQKTVFKYNKETKKMILDKTSSGAAYNNIIDWELLPSKDNKVKVRILVDEGVIETFGNDGEANISDLYFPSADSVGMEFFAIGGDVKVDSMKIYDMKSMFTGKSLSDGELPTKVSLATPERVELGDTFDVTANIYPTTAKDKDVTWSYDEGLTLVKNEDGTATFKADKAGKFNVSVKTKAGNLEKTVTINVIKAVFNTNVLNWNSVSGKWVKTESGLNGNNAGEGDSFIMTDTKLKKDVPFTYEADIHLESGAAAGMVFGVADAKNPSRNWLCINVEKGTQNVAKIFKNTGLQDWSREYKLTDEEKALKDFHLKLVYDGTSMEYFLNRKSIAKIDNANFEGGYVGLNTFRSNSTFNNVVLTTDAPINSIVTNFDTIEVFENTDMDAITSKLVPNAIVEKEDGIQQQLPITWDTSKVDLNIPGEYVIVGTMPNTALKAEVKVVVKAIKLESTNPASLSATALQGTKAEDIFNTLTKDVVGTYSDGSTKDLVLTGWDVSKVDFNKPGVYNVKGYLNTDRNLTINIKITITKKDAPVIENKTLVNKDKTISVVGKLPDDVTLFTNYLKSDAVAKLLKDKTYLNTRVFEQIIDFSLFKDGQEFVTTNELTVNINMKAEWKGKKLFVISIDEAGNIVNVEYVVKDGKIVFKTKNLSMIAIVSDKKTPTKPTEPGGDVNTSDETNLPALYTLLASAGLGALYFRRKGKKVKE